MFSGYARGEKKVWDQTPDYFETYAETAAAKPWIENALNGVIDAGVPLSYWWCYQSDRPMDQGKPQRFDLSRERNPELVAFIVEANKRLQAKLVRPHALPTDPARQSQIRILRGFNYIRLDNANRRTESNEAPRRALPPWPDGAAW